MTNPIFEQADMPNNSHSLSLLFKEKMALHAAYMPYVKGGGLFIPSNKSLKMGEAVTMLLSLLDDPIKLQVIGHVVWLSPANQASMPQGVGVQFNEQADSVAAREKIESLLGDDLKSTRLTHTM